MFLKNKRFRSFSIYTEDDRVDRKLLFFKNIYYKIFTL